MITSGNLAERERVLDDIGTSLPPADNEFKGLDELEARQSKPGMSKPKTTAQDSDAVVHDDADIPGMVSEHVDREAYPEGLDDDTMLIRFPGLAPGASGDVPDDGGVDLFFDGHDDNEM